MIPAGALLTNNLTTLASFSAYAAVGVLLLAAVGFAAGNFVATHVLGPSRRGENKGIAWESGMNPIGSARRRFNVRFFIVAMTFLLFDVEIVFLFPWAVTFPALDAGSDLNGQFLLRMLFFVFTSVVAFVYAWRKGVFRYD